LPADLRATDEELRTEIDAWMQPDAHLPVSSLVALNAILNVYF
jgi:hypothetical protein